MAGVQARRRREKLPGGQTSPEYFVGSAVSGGSLWSPRKN